MFHTAENTAQLPSQEWVEKHYNNKWVRQDFKKAKLLLGIS